MSFTERELNRLLTDLADLADWFEAFGNYTRAKDVDRLVDGIELYKQDILTYPIEPAPSEMPDEYHDEF